MIMTQNKAQKTAARQRMAETGEPYSVARRAVQDHPPGAGEAGQIFVRYRLAGTFELEIDEEVWARADNQTRARLIADGDGPGSSHPGTTLSELIAHDLDERGPGAFTGTDREWEEEYYADGAASEGISVEEFRAREASGQTQEWAQERAQERADQAQERADQAQERADLALEQAEEARGRAEEAQDRADEARGGADEARHVAEETREDGDRAAWEQAERDAGLAQERADRAQSRADREQERAERERERAEREQGRADREQELAGGGHAFGYHSRSGPAQPPRPPHPPRPPGLPRLPRLPRLPG
jgi:hypothetical protein